MRKKIFIILISFLILYEGSCKNQSLITNCTSNQTDCNYTQINETNDDSNDTINDECLINNCIMCQGQICLQCEQNFTLKNENKTCVQEECEIVEFSYMGNCKNCTILNCQMCNITFLNDSNETLQSYQEYCIQCKDGYILKSDQNQSLCIQQPVIENISYCNPLPNCLTCQIQNNQEVCMSCNTSYQLKTAANGTKICVLIINCSAGLTFLDNVCKCRYGYYLQDEECVSCLKYCSKCTSKTTCQQCYEGYFYEQEKCQPCPANCAQCSSNLNCTSCKLGFGLTDSGQCQYSRFYTGFITIVINSTTQLVPCQFGCSSCSIINNMLACLSCIQGRYLSSTNSSQNPACLPCPSGCRHCSKKNGADAVQCDECYEGFLLDQEENSCVPCDSKNCLVCQGNSSFCVLCLPGLYLQSNNSCSPCPDRCLDCNQTKCFQCENGFISVNGKCIQCALGCSVCSPTNISQCIGCNIGFYFNQTTSKCQACASNCNKCDINGCIECQLSLVNDGGVCVESCSHLCAVCQKNNGQFECTQCLYGYVLISNTCQPKQSLLEFGYCKPAYYWNGTFCNLCGIPDKKCVGCELVDGQQVCTKCDLGYILEQTGCVECEEGCQSCLSKTNCFTCKNGYFMYQYQGKNTGKCLPCSFTSYCSTCIYSPTQCQTCVNDFVLDGFKCISYVNIGVGLLIDKQPSYIFEHLDQIKQFLLTAINYNKSNLNLVSINRFWLGSTILDMNVSIPDQNDALNAGYNIYKSLKNNSFPFPLLSSAQVVINNYNQKEDLPNFRKSNEKVGIIFAGVFIGLFVAALIFLCICWNNNRRKMAQNQQHPKNQNQIHLGPVGSANQLQQKRERDDLSEKSQNFD